MSEHEDKGFKVEDKRAFQRDAEGEFTRRLDSETAPPTEGAPNESPEEKDQRRIPLPELNFATFILTLHTNALIHLGVLADPETRQAQPNLPLAAQTIDLIAMLQTKTQGNRDETEERLITQVLYELRMKYVEAATGKKTPTKPAGAGS